MAHTQLRWLSECPTAATPAPSSLVSQVQGSQPGPLQRSPGGADKKAGAQIHQKHFLFTFLVFRLRSCFSGAGGSAGDFGGEDASSAGSASSRLCRTSWNLPSCCRKSYSTLKNRKEEKSIQIKAHWLCIPRSPTGMKSTGFGVKSLVLKDPVADRVALGRSQHLSEPLIVYRLN